MRTICICVLVLVGCGVEGPQGPAGPPGPGAIKWVERPEESTIPWARNPTQGWEYARLHSFAGLGGLPPGVSHAIFSVDLCAIGQPPSGPGGAPRPGEGGVAVFGWEEFDSFDSQNLFADTQCLQRNGQFLDGFSWLPGDPVYQYGTSQLWLQLNGAQEVRLRSLRVRELVPPAYLIRLRLLGWSE